MQFAIAFLCTRVKNPDTDDYKKLARHMKYLEATIELSLILGMNESRNIRWYVDGAFAVDSDTKSHTGAIVTLGQGESFWLYYTFHMLQ